MQQVLVREYEMQCIFVKLSDKYPLMEVYVAI